MSESAGERTEQASERQLKEVRRKGKLSRSADVSGWVVVAACAVMVPATLTAAQAAATDQLFQVQRAAQQADPQVALQVLAEAGASLGPTLLPLLAAGTIAAALVPFSQGPVRFRSMAPRFDHFNPVSAAKRLLGPSAWWNAAKALVKSALIGTVLYVVVNAAMTALMGTGLMRLEAVSQVAAQSAVQLLWLSILAGLVMAAADVAVVARRNRKQTRVTKQEAKREHKNSEGDPLIRSQRRSRQLSMSRNRMIADVSSATAVVVNPVHVAVALRYREGDPAPVVVASGKGEVAARIRQRAAEAQVPLVRSVELAWMMHRHCRVGAAVPPELFSAVATIIAFTLKLDARQGTRRIHEVGQVDLPEHWQA